MAEPERLKHAPQPVIQVVAQHDHGDDVEHRRRPELKSRHYVVVHVVNIEGTAWMDRAKREVQQMVNHESQDDRPAPHHGARSVGGMKVGLFRVRNRPSSTLQPPQRERSPDMQADRRQKGDSRAPQQRWHAPQHFGVVINFLRWLVDLQITGQMPDDKAKQDEPRHRHDSFFADCGIPKAQPCQRIISGSAHSPHLTRQVSAGFKKQSVMRGRRTRRGRVAVADMSSPPRISVRFTFYEPGERPACCRR